jgi:hypothetical protein
MREQKPNPLLVNRRNKENPINSKAKAKLPLQKYATLHVRQTLSENLPQNMQDRQMAKYNNGYSAKQPNPKGISLANVKNAVVFKAKKEYG